MLSCVMSTFEGCKFVYAFGLVKDGDVSVWFYLSGFLNLISVFSYSLHFLYATCVKLTKL